MDSQGPISVSAPGVSLIGVAAKDITFSTRYPFHKLDSTNMNSFEIISVFFNTEPPDPVMPTSTATFSNTLVYKYAHGYTYTPSTWFLLSLDNFATTIGSEGAMILTIGQIPGSTNAIFNIQVDSTYVYFYVAKTWGYVFGTPDPNPPHIIGFTVSVRAYIFVNDILGGDVPSQP